jgi:hypothetical protein
LQRMIVEAYQSPAPLVQRAKTFMK